MGRKRTHTDATRSRIVSARLKPETYDLISEHADKLGLSRAGYVEHLIENRPLRLARPLADDMSVPLINELKRIGNNLNQIAHARNSGLDVDPRQFRTLVTQIIATICSNEVMRRRYEAAETEIAGQTGQVIVEDLPLRKAAQPSKSPASGTSGSPGGTQPPPAPPANQAATQAHRPQAPAESPPTPKRAPDGTSPGQASELRLKKQDFHLRLWPSDSLIAPAPPQAGHSAKNRSQTGPGRTHDPKTSSSWFKLPWGLRLRASRRR